MFTTQKIIDHALSHGLIMLDNTQQLTHAPITVLPSNYPNTAFKQAQQLSQDLQQLFFTLSQQPELVISLLQPVAKIDEFTRHLLELYQTAQQHPYYQPIQLGLLRFDYLLSSTKQAKLVEINTIASSFAGLATKTTKLHQFFYPDNNIPNNHSLAQLSLGLANAWQSYQQANAVICFVVQSQENNRFDQYHIEADLWQRFKIKVIRCSLSEINQQATVNPQGKLIIKQQEVAVVYFRAGYHPNDYPTKQQWQARLLLEQSLAIKCPSLLLHLCGKKKIQQAFSQPPLLQQLTANSKALKTIEAGLVDIQVLNPSNAELALKNPDNYILKPPREGGGHNKTGQALINFVQHTPIEQYPAWILMEKIQATTYDNAVLRQNQLSPKQALISELGLFGVLLIQSNKILYQSQSGYLLRSKPINQAEGGIMAGASVLDSPNLV